MLSGPHLMVFASFGRLGSFLSFYNRRASASLSPRSPRSRRGASLLRELSSLLGRISSWELRYAHPFAILPSCLSHAWRTSAALFAFWRRHVAPSSLVLLGSWCASRRLPISAESAFDGLLGRAPRRAVVFFSIALASALRVLPPRVAASSSPVLLDLRLLDWGRRVSAPPFRSGFSARGRFSAPRVAYHDLFVCRHVALGGLYQSPPFSPSGRRSRALFLSSADPRCGLFPLRPVVLVDWFLSHLLSRAPGRGVRGGPVVPPRGASAPLLPPSLLGAGPRSPGLPGLRHRPEPAPRSCIPVALQPAASCWQRSGTFASPCSRRTTETRRLSRSSRRSFGPATRRSGA